MSMMRDSGWRPLSEDERGEALRATLGYYEHHAGGFARRTGDIDMAGLYAEFLPFLPAGGRVLDAGCGTGRDSAVFIERGFLVTAFDASKEMADIAAARIGRPVLHLSFQQLSFVREFDGVWACASLLHVPKATMGEVFSRLHAALVPGGTLYASFKRGAGESFREGRFFNDYDEDELLDFVSGQLRWTSVRVWRTEDIGQFRPGLEWVHLVARAL
jgi:SAM-dependent methyltransferase